jgi:hypothetical protein
MSHVVRAGIEVPSDQQPISSGTAWRPADPARLLGDAAAVLELWADPAVWAQRRVERLDLVDSDWIRRSVTLALIVVTPISVTQSAVAALLLVLPGVLVLYQTRVGGLVSFIEFWALDNSRSSGHSLRQRL